MNQDSIQLTLINKLKIKAQNDENISAILMYGSFTKGEGDQYSDIEFYIYLKNIKLFSAKNWVNDIQPVALYFKNEYGSDVAIFENMIRGEFHFESIEKIEVIKTWDGFLKFSEFKEMNLVDKEGKLSNILNQIKVKSPDRTTSENILWLSESLLNVLLTTSNLIKRQEYAHAHHSLNNTHKYLLWLIRIVTNETNHWESPTKRLEKDIESKWYTQFQLVTSNLETENLNNAVRNALNLTKKLFEELKVPLKLHQILARIK